MLKDGLYEKVVSDSLADELAALPHKYKELANIDKAEAAKILAQYVAAVVERGLKAVRDNSEDIASQVALVNEIIATVQEKTQEQDFSAMKVDETGQQLLALYDRQDSILALGAAMSSGLEWNVKITAQDQPETLAKIAATFASYWESREFETYTAAEELRLYRALRDEKYFKEGNTTRYTLDVRPYSYQQEILDKLAAPRPIPIWGGRIT